LERDEEGNLNPAPNREGELKPARISTETYVYRHMDSKERLMKMKFLAGACALVFALGFAMTATAGVILDNDSDLIPDVLDNCTLVANGPGQPGINQTDGDNDGFGTACDCDYTQDGTVLGDDLLELFGFFNQSDVSPFLHDNTGDGLVLGDDILKCFGYFNGPPGPAGAL
jgi:hypothetical protein